MKTVPFQKIDPNDNDIPLAAATVVLQEHFVPVLVNPDGDLRNPDDRRLVGRHRIIVVRDNNYGARGFPNFKYLLGAHPDSKWQQWDDPTRLTLLLRIRYIVIYAYLIDRDLVDKQLAQIPEWRQFHSLWHIKSDAKPFLGFPRQYGLVGKD